MSGSKLLDELNTFTQLCKNKDGKGLVEFAKANRHYVHRVQRGIIEHCDAAALNLFIEQAPPPSIDVDNGKALYALIIEQVLFFNKGKVDRLTDFGENIVHLTADESDIIWMATIEANAKGKTA